MSQKTKTQENIATAVFGSAEMKQSAPAEAIPKHKTAPEIAYQMVKDETFP